LLDRPLGIDPVQLDFRYDSIDEQTVLKNQKVRINEKGRFRRIAPLQLSLHALELRAGFFNGLAETGDFRGNLFGVDAQMKRNEQRVECTNGMTDGDTG